MSKTKVPVHHCENGLPFDEYGHVLDPLSYDPASEDQTGEPFTDPYGELMWCVGTEDDFMCFDYAFLPDGRIVLHCVVNSETGHFIQDESYGIYDQKEAVEVAYNLIDNAFDWLAEGGDPLEHDAEGWNQEPYWFARCVKAAVEGKGSPPRFEEEAEVP